MPTLSKRFLIIAVLLAASQTIIATTAEANHIYDQSQLQQDEQYTIDRPFEPLEPNDVTTTSADQEYCSRRGRPYTNEKHYRWSPPYPDANFKSTEKLPLPDQPTDVHLFYSVGRPKTYKMRFRSHLITYPKAEKYGDFYKLPGYEDKYPETANQNCVSNFVYPFHGVSITIQDGDNTEGPMFINGYEPLRNENTRPPYNDETSGVYGYKFTPQASQLGKTYRLYVIAQTGVTPTERDCTYPAIYESDQIRYTLYLHVQAATDVAALEVYGNSGDIHFRATSIPIVFPEERDKQWKDAYFYIDNQPGIQADTTPLGSRISSDEDGRGIARLVNFDSLKLVDGWHTVKVRAVNFFGIWSESAPVKFEIINYPTVDGPAGPAPTASGVIQRGLSRDRTDPSAGPAYVYAIVEAPSGYEFKDVYLFDAGGAVVRSTFFPKQGRSISVPGGDSLYDSRHVKFVFNRTKYLGQRAYFKVRYTDGSVGISQIILIPTMPSN